MNILMVLSDNKYPPDGRVEREARDLIRAGHDVYLMARRGVDQPTREVCDGVNVIRVELPFQRCKFAADLIYQVFQKYLIVFHILKACRRHQIDALHVHDLPYAWATVRAGKKLGIPVVFDMHENYLEMMKNGIEARGYRFTKP
ncbi:MAG: glycosyltransferase, partial [Planctomycetes bacterium]|nr:glycosyltransferase [Planctomycetota bacterium]